MKAFYNGSGEQITIEQTITVNGSGLTGNIIKSVSHRGCNTDGKLAGYKRAKQLGFLYGENDINFTSDGIPIMRHDGKISVDGVSTSIASLTYEELMAVDSDIPTLAEFLELCRNIGLYPYLDTKRWSETWSLDNLTIALNVCAASGILHNITWLIGTLDEAEHILAFNEEARIGWLEQPTESKMASLLALRTDKNDLFFDSDYSNLTEENIQRCVDNKVPLEVYTIKSESVIYDINKYVTGFTADGTIVASSLLYDANIE